MLITGDIGWDMLVVKMHLPPVTTRLYAMHDANFNVTGLVTSDGEVAQRYVYDAYGTYSILNEDWVQSTPAAGYVNWVYLHQGGRLDGFTGLYHFRHRDYDPTLGRWISQDPAGYVDGGSLYLAYRSNPNIGSDPLGLTTIVKGPRDALAHWIVGGGGDAELSKDLLAAFRESAPYKRLRKDADDSIMRGITGCDDSAIGKAMTGVAYNTGTATESGNAYSVELNCTIGSIELTDWTATIVSKRETSSCCCDYEIRIEFALEDKYAWFGNNNMPEYWVLVFPNAVFSQTGVALAGYPASAADFIVRNQWSTTAYRELCKQ